MALRQKGQMGASSFSKRWHSSVAFKLGTATAAIVFIVALLQASVGLQTFRLAKAQQSIVEMSVPMLARTQEFARITTRMLGQTALLEERLSVDELTKLRSLYFVSEAKSDELLVSMKNVTNDPGLIEAILQSRQDFAIVNEKMFDNQFRQRALEEEILQSRNQLYKKATTFEDLLDQMLINSTVFILRGPTFQDFEEAPPEYIEQILKFATEIETLNSLKSNITDIQNILQSLRVLQGAFQVDAYAERLRLDIRSITQSLPVLEDLENRRKLARLSAGINSTLMAPGGLVSVLQNFEDTREDFDMIRKQQIETVGQINRTVRDLIDHVTLRFDRDISLASKITNSFFWIGLATAGLVFGGIIAVNHFVIRRQISSRFLTLTEDVAAVAQGDYSHDIRVGGRDELGDIAKALDQFRCQAAELERSNSELERFAYVAAHDLRSPLDAIQDLARWTLEDERNSLSENCIRNLELMIQRSARLSALQSDLLTYARLGEVDTSIGAFSLNDEVAKMADLLDPAQKFDISVENDPGTIEIHRLPTQQILINLITNAIKHHDRPAGKILVRYEGTECLHRLVVEDDGPGIEPRFQAKVFELFKTLQSRDSTEGSGLGLALVRKLTQRLGGSVTVQSNAPAERGTRFTVEFKTVDPPKNAQKAA